MAVLFLLLLKKVLNLMASKPNLSFPKLFYHGVFVVKCCKTETLITKAGMKVWEIMMSRSILHNKGIV